MQDRTDEARFAGSIASVLVSVMSTNNRWNRVAISQDIYGAGYVHACVFVYVCARAYSRIVKCV